MHVLTDICVCIFNIVKISLTDNATLVIKATSLVIVIIHNCFLIKISIENQSRTIH